jgi:ABC-type dipeptide/oligopeptide/nickel transport systems, permease components
MMKQSARFVLTIIGLFLAGSLPALFQGLYIDVANYLTQMGQIALQLLHPGRMTYIYEGKAYPLFPALFQPYLYSMELFFTALFLALVASSAAIYVTVFLPEKVRRVVSFLAFIGESLPDIFIIVMFQLAVIWIYQRTGVLVMNMTQAFDTHIFVLPVLCMFILPACFLYHMMVLSVKNERQRDYVDLARGKGLNPRQILLRHIFRNAAANLASYSKSLVWTLLSSLVVTEFMFGINGGLTMFIYTHPTPLVFTVSLLLIFIPLYVLFTVVSVLIRQLTGIKVAI